MARTCRTRTRNVRRVFNAIVGKNLTKYEWDKEIAPGITAIGTPGHTPGHTSFVIASGRDKLLVQADVDVRDRAGIRAQSRLVRRW